MLPAPVPTPGEIDPVQQSQFRPRNISTLAAGMHVFDWLRIETRTDREREPVRDFLIEREGIVYRCHAGVRAQIEAIYIFPRDIAIPLSLHIRLGSGRFRETHLMDIDERAIPQVAQFHSPAWKGFAGTVEQFVSRYAPRSYHSLAVGRHMTEGIRLLRQCRCPTTVSSRSTLAS